MVAPPLTAARTSSAKCPKSAERIEGASSIRMEASRWSGDSFNSSKITRHLSPNSPAFHRTRGLAGLAACDGIKAMRLGEDRDRAMRIRSPQVGRLLGDNIVPEIPQI